MIAEEQASFRTRTGLRADQFAVTSALTDALRPALLDGVDAVMIGGAGAYSVVDTFAWTAGLVDVCRACADRGVPLFGSCWGHQFVARAFGGEVVNDPVAGRARDARRGADRGRPGGTRCSRRSPTGSRPRWATTTGSAGSRRAPSSWPPNDRAPYQAFRLDGAPVYGTQFHSELDAETERGRLVTYRAYYPEMADDDVFADVLAGLRPSPEADDLLRRFLLLYAVEGGAGRLEAAAASRN